MRSLLTLVVVASLGRIAQAQSGAATATSVLARDPIDTPATRLLNRGNLTRLTSGYYSRSRDYRLIHQDIAVWDLAWPTKSFAGRVRTTVTSLRTPMATLRLDAGANLTITKVVDGRGRTMAFDHPADTLIVHLATPVPYGDSARVTVEYRGKDAAGLYFIEEDGPRQPRQLWSVGSKITNHTWFPTCDLQNNKATWDLTVTAAKTDRVISNGRLVSDTPAPRSGDSLHVVHWRMDRPASTYLASIVVAPLVTIRNRSGSVPLEYNVYRADSAVARNVFSATAKAMATYAKLTGVPYPWPRYAQTEVAGAPWGGMENVSATTLFDRLPTSWGPDDRPFYVYRLVPHELAHQWFGNYLTHDNWANTWLSEGFADFMTGHYWASEFGPAGREEFFLRQYQQWMKADGTHHVAVAGPSEDAVYTKGSLVLEMLRTYLGDALFWRTVHAFLVRHPYGNADTEDWRKTIFDVTGQNLAWFFDEWIYGSGYPDFTVRAAYDSAARRLTLAVEQTQAAGRTPFEQDGDTTFYETPAVFQMPVTIRVGTAGGDIVHRTWLAQRQQTIVIDSLAGAPTMVAFDDDNGILKTLRFDQPTAWLATLLARDSNAWNDAWAIQQLRTRTNDPAASAALAAAASRSKYAAIRAQAKGTQ